jgi:hypothetical protein
VRSRLSAPLSRRQYLRTTAVARRATRERCPASARGLGFDKGRDRRCTAGLLLARDVDGQGAPARLDQSWPGFIRMMSEPATRQGDDNGLPPFLGSRSAACGTVTKIRSHVSTREVDNTLQGLRLSLALFHCKKPEGLHAVSEYT